MKKVCPKMMRKQLMGGRMIEPLKLDGNTNVKNFVKNVFGGSGYNARSLYDACVVVDKMIKNDTTIAITLAGAMTPIGMSGPIIKLIEKGMVDFMISTGANLYHDMHRAFELPMKQGDANIDDYELDQCGIARIYDVYIDDDGTLLATDKIVLKFAEEANFDGPISTADLHYELGKFIAKHAPSPKKSLLAAAYKYKVPIYTSSPGDSSIAMNLMIHHFYKKRIEIDPLLDIMESTALVWQAKKNGVIEIGGGSPKNFYMQTQPTLWQILNMDKGGHDYFVQLTTDAPHWGGLSGATPQEAVSWGKIQTGSRDYAVVYSDASITFPLIAQYANMAHKAKKHKKLYLVKDKLTKQLLKKAEKNLA